MHLVFGKGKYKGGYPFVKNKYGVWVLPTQIDPREVLYINGTTVLDDKGYKFKSYAAPFKASGVVEAIEDGIRIRTAPNLKASSDTGLKFNKGNRLSYVSVAQGDGWYFAKYKTSSGAYRYTALCKINGDSRYWKQV